MVKKVQQSLWRHSSNYFQGMFRSKFKGSGIQFKEHQVYQYGDDVRFIDWSLLARKNTPYVKTFEEERNVHILCVLPIRSSLVFKDSYETKIESILETVCFFILMAKKTKDYVDVIIDFNGVHYIRNLQGENGLLSLFKNLERHKVINTDGRIRYEIIIKEARKFDFGGIKKYLSHKKETLILADGQVLNTSLNKKIVYPLNPRIFNFFASWEKSFTDGGWINSGAVNFKVKYFDQKTKHEFKGIYPIEVNGQHLESVTQYLLGHK